MDTLYVRNTDDATIICRLPSDKKKVFVFKSKKIDKRNNVVLSNGFTEVSEADLKLLRDESSTFQYYEKLQKIAIVDTLPLESMSTDQLVASLRNENAKLKMELAKDEKPELEKALAKIEEQKKDIEILEEQVSNLLVEATPAEEIE